MLDEMDIPRRALRAVAGLLLLGAAGCGGTSGDPSPPANATSAGAPSAGAGGDGPQQAGGAGGEAAGSGGSGGAGGGEASAGGQAGSHQGRDCGAAEDVIAVGARILQGMTAPTPELERLRGCTRYGGTLHLLMLSGPESIDALTDLREIAGSLVLVLPPEDLGPLSNLTRIEGRLVVLGAQEEGIRGLQSLRYVSGLWLYESYFADFSWLPALTEINASMIARRNSRMTAETLESFAASRVRDGALVSLTNSVPADPPDPDAEAVVCGEPGDLVFGPRPELAGCTRFRGSIHLSDTVPSGMDALSSLVHIDGSLTLFRNHTDDFTALRNLRRVGALFQLHLIETPGLAGFDSLAEVGELNVATAGQLSSFDWLPALARVRESARLVKEPPLSSAAVESLLSRLDVGGEIVVMSRE